MQTDFFSQPKKSEKTPTPLTIKDMFGYTREAWLEECRKTAKLLLRHSETITVEDVTKLVPRPTYLHRNTTGRIFNEDFVPVDFVKAKHPAAKGRWIRTWRIK